MDHGIKGKLDMLQYDFPYITKIPKQHRQSSVIMLGRGPSVDKLDLDALNTQMECDTCTITDAIKLVKYPTYAFNYHDQGLRRIRDYIQNPTYLIVPKKLIMDLKKKKWYGFLNRFQEQQNVYLFQGHNEKDLNVFRNGDFDIQVERQLWNRHGSVVGVIHFLCGYMKYRHIYYIGFDGGTEYGQLVHSSRKKSKQIGAANDYQRSWNTVQAMIEHYDVVFEPLDRFLKNEV